MIELAKSLATDPLEDRIDCLVSTFSRRVDPRPVPAWILPPLSCEFLTELGELLPEPRRTFEFGSGQSTHTLRALSSGMTTIEHSADWREKTERDFFPKKRAADYFAVVPLRRCWNRLRLIESFDLDSHPEVAERLRQAHLILVDSPPNPAKREHALYLALHHAPVGAVVVADDLEIGAVRRFASRLAKQNKNQFRYWTLEIDHRLGIFLKLKPGRIRSIPALREFVGTWLRV